MGSTLAELSLYFGAPPDTIFRHRTAFFEVLAGGACSDVTLQKRGRWLRCLFGLGAKCSSARANQICVRYYCNLRPYIYCSPPLRNIFLTQPEVLEYLVNLKNPPLPKATETLCWAGLLHATYCLNTRRIGFIYCTPWRPETFTKDAESVVRTIFLAAQRQKLGGQAAVRICVYLGFLKCPPHSPRALRSV